jgi:transcriptional regulator with XRE-family HTH domain
MTSFPSWLRRQMDSREWGVTKLSKELGVSHGLVSQWLSGQRNPSPRSIDRIADVLFVDVDEVLTVAGHRPRDFDADPDSPPERFHAMMKRIHWDPQREAMIDAILRQMVEFDRSGRDD